MNLSRWRARASTGHLVMVAAGLAGFVVSFTAITGARGGVEVVVAAREIVAGERVLPADLRTEAVRANGSLLRTLLRRREVARVGGYVATTTIEAGELVEQGELRRRAAPRGLRAMSIGVDPAFAVAGRLARGDRVDVLSSDEPAIVVADVEVIAVDTTARGGIAGTSGAMTVTVAVDADQSVALAGAMAHGDLVVARTTGATRSTPTSSTADSDADSDMELG